MHDIGGIIWIIIVLIGVISSIRRNVQRARAKSSAAQRPAQMQPARQQVAPPPLTVTAQRFTPKLDPATILPPVVAAPPPIVPAMPVAPPPAAFPGVARVGTSPIRGMFDGSATLVRAIVAAEVLGPPISQQERTIWSPRHSEPSI